MSIEVNGDEVEVRDGISIYGLLEHLGIPERGIAVAVDHTVVAKSDWGQALADGSRVEVVTAVQGG